ncbi:hypothetical protein TSUD_197010 [Trifolium subterraneum]|uniref:Uncharacterized protein n=1 Tax=Trifolium subterraneum TaxID=3900 RepID=A0A2Z6LJS8_TRISU|nr:hypothetical protein TSUD_197010 [Trifolium subterraneum]
MPSKSNGKLKATIQVEEEPVQQQQQQHQFSNQELAECLFKEDLAEALQFDIDYFDKSTPLWQAAKEYRAQLPAPPFYELYPSEEMFLEHQKIQMKLFLDRQATNLAIFRLQKNIHEYKMEQVNRNTQNLDLDLDPGFGPGSVQDPPKQG